MSDTAIDVPPSFWKWFARGTGKKAGYRRIFNRWILLHMLVGALAASVVDLPLTKIASGALLPLLAVLVGLTFSWAGNAHAILQSEEVTRFMVAKKGGAPEFVFAFQLCVLVNICTIGAWTIPLLGAPYLLDFLPYEQFDTASRFVLFAMISLAVRTGWHAVLGANMLLLLKISGAIK